MPSLDEAKDNVKATMEINRERIQTLQNEIRKLQQAGFNTTTLEIELSKAKARNERLGALL